MSAMRRSDQERRPASVRASAPRTALAGRPDLRQDALRVCVALIIDVYSRMIAGPQASRTLRSISRNRRAGDGGVEPAKIWSQCTTPVEPRLTATDTPTAPGAVTP